MRTDVLGVGFDPVTPDEAADRALRLSAEGRGAYVCTPNAEIVMLCRKNAALMEAVNGADLVVPDGIGVVRASKTLGRPLPARVAGIDLFTAMLERLGETEGTTPDDTDPGPARACRKGQFSLTHSDERVRENRPSDTQGGANETGDGSLSHGGAEGLLPPLQGEGDRAGGGGVRPGGVFLYGGAPGTAEAAAEEIRRAYPGVTVCGTADGYRADDADVLRQIEETRPVVTAVCLGSPKQELWMAAHRGLETGVMLGLGGTLDVLAGKTARAPEHWRDRGLEWLWRLLHDPRRLKRQLCLPAFLLAVRRQRINEWKKAD